MKEGIILDFPTGFSPIGLCIANNRCIIYSHQSFCSYDMHGNLLGQTLFSQSVKSVAFHPKKEFGYILSDNLIPSISSIDMKGIIHKTFYPNKTDIDHISYDLFGGLFLHTLSENFRLFFTMSSVHTVPVTPYFIGTKDKCAILNVENGEVIYYSLDLSSSVPTLFRERIYILAK